jgi:hypothetical protein
LFTPIGLPGGDDSYYRVIRPKAVTDNKNAKRETHAEHNKTVLVLGMIRVDVAHCIFIEEDRLGFLEGNFVLSLILLALPVVPFESNITHMYTVFISMSDYKPFLALALYRQRRGANRSGTQAAGMDKCPLFEAKPLDCGSDSCRFAAVCISNASGPRR